LQPIKNDDRLFYSHGDICGLSGVVNGTLQLPPLPPSNPAERKGERNERRIGDLQPTTKDGPVLGSLILGLVCIAVAFPLGIRGMAIFDSPPTLYNVICLLIATYLAFVSTIGLLFGWDLWSVLQL
jgi:hypothetical protein